MEPELRNMHGMVRRTQNDTDVVLLFDYTDQEGIVTRRVTSPIRVHQSGDSFLALCFSRERPSSFRFERCANMRIDKAHKYLMPVPLAILSVVAESNSDTEQVTVASLKAIGWTNHSDEEWAVMRSPGSRPKGGPVAYIEWNALMGCDGWRVNGNDGALIGPFDTIGEVVALCKALNIPIEKTIDIDGAPQETPSCGE